MPRPRADLARVRSLFDPLLDILFAPRCLGCDGPILSGDGARLVCRQCRGRLLPPPAPLCARCGAPRLRTGRIDEARCIDCASWPAWLRCARSAFLLCAPADRLVHQLKYGGWQALAAPMGALMAAVALPEDVRREAQPIVPVPTTVQRRRQRGYDQAELLARALAQRRGIALAMALERTSSTRSQTLLQPAARGANVAGAFRVAARWGSALRGAHPLLVDDVLTTGATAVECARALVDAGARCVSVITFARAPGARRLDTSESEQAWPPASRSTASAALDGIS